jgi:hypothetical protein
LVILNWKRGRHFCFGSEKWGSDVSVLKEQIPTDSIAGDLDNPAVENKKPRSKNRMGL